MNLKELLEKRSALLAEVDSADEKRFAEIQTEISKIDLKIAEARKDAAEAEKRAKAEADANAEAEKRAAEEAAAAGRKPSGGMVFDQTANAEAEKRAAEKAAIEERAASLKSGKEIQFETRALLTTNLGATVVAENGVNSAFNETSYLCDKVNVEHYEGLGRAGSEITFDKGELEGYVDKEGGSNAGKGKDLATGIAKLKSTKISVLTSVSEDIFDLPAERTENFIMRKLSAALKHKLSQQIVFGKGVESDELVGINTAPTEILDADATKVVSATIAKDFFSKFAYKYGGAQDVQANTVLIINKLTLEEFAKVVDKNDRPMFNIVMNDAGDGGTINGYAFICASFVKPFASVAANEPYAIYGKLPAYQLEYYSDVKVRTEGAIEDGIVKIKATTHAGGSPVFYNSFIKIVKTTA